MSENMTKNNILPSLEARLMQIVKRSGLLHFINTNNSVSVNITKKKHQPINGFSGVDLICLFPEDYPVDKDVDDYLSAVDQMIDERITPIVEFFIFEQLMSKSTSELWYGNLPEKLSDEDIFKFSSDKTTALKLICAAKKFSLDKNSHFAGWEELHYDHYDLVLIDQLKGTVDIEFGINLCEDTDRVDIYVIVDANALSCLHLDFVKDINKKGLEMSGPELHPRTAEDILPRVIERIFEQDFLKSSNLQREFGIGYNTAVELLELLIDIFDNKKMK